MQSQFTAYYNGSRVHASWSLSSTDYASISSSGLLAARSVSSNQTVNLKAIYSRYGRTYEAYKAVTITNSGGTSGEGGGGTARDLKQLSRFRSEYGQFRSFGKLHGHREFQQ